MVATTLPTRMAFEMGETPWSPSSWRRSGTVKRHMPVYVDKRQLIHTKNRLREVPPLIFARETQTLKERLSCAQMGEGFVLQGGDCAESITVESKDGVIELVELLNEMAFTLSYHFEIPVFTIARVAGQYAKPRSSPTETREGVTLPAFMGTIVNSPTFEKAKRDPDPTRMMTAYRHASSVQTMIRSMVSSGFVGTDQVASSLKDGYARKAARMLKSRDNLFSDETLYISHEALLLEYEECLTRMDRNTGEWYNTAAHMVWLGERTRFPSSAHVEYLSGIANPIGIKVGPSADVDQIRTILAKINPSRETGKIVLIFRMGVRDMVMNLPPLLYGLKEESAVFMVDPMHGNTRESASTALKTRNVEDIFKEMVFFHRTCVRFGIHFGGAHLELCGSDRIYECVGRGGEPDPLRYTTLCDPRLNASQSMQLVEFLVRECM